MGQSGSKSQRPPAQNAEASTSAAPATEFGALEQHDRSSSSTTNSESRSRRPSLRKRVVSLIKPSSGRAREVSEASTSGLAGSPAAETVKHKASWRKSRRWSKSPVDFKPSQPTLVEDAERPSSPHSSSLRQQSIPSMQSSDKGKKRADDIEDDQEEPSVGDVTPQVYTPSERTLTPYPSMTEILPPPRRRGSTARHPDPPRVAEGSGSQHPSSSLPDPTPEAVPTTSNSTTPASPSTSPSLPTRQFPPPGTLVVVQGIVHTTDVSRGPSPNNLPSGLDANSNVNMDSNTTRGSLPVPPLRRQSSAPAISGRSSTETNLPSSTQSPDPVAPTSTSHSAISPGSIDVLGTLLRYVWTLSFLSSSSTLLVWRLLSEHMLNRPIFISHLSSQCRRSRNGSIASYGLFRPHFDVESSAYFIIAVLRCQLRFINSHRLVIADDDGLVYYCPASIQHRHDLRRLPR